jgi:hypothetical protein
MAKVKVKAKVKVVKKGNVWMSIWAVLAGFLVVVVLSTSTDSILESAGILPPANQPGVYMSTWMLVIALLYRSVYTVLGGYVTALLSPQNPMKHVKVLAILGTIGGVMGIIAGWNLSEHWYPIAIAITAYPLVIWGGKLRIKKHKAL